MQSRQRRYYRGRRPERAHSIDELASMAASRLPRFAREYLEAGAEDEITLADNRAAFAGLGWHPRTGIDVAQVDASRRWAGGTTPYPLAIGPTGYNDMLWPNADLALARAAHDHGLPFTLSTVACATIESVREAVPDGRLWFQLYCLGDETVQGRLLERAATAQYETLVVTTDAVVLGRREWDRRSYLAPGTLTWRNRLDALFHPQWLYRVLWPDGLPTLGNLLEFLPHDQRTALGAAQFIGQRMDRSVTWDTLARLREQWHGRMIVKGVLDPDDAVRCQSLGADGIVVSNHGGRQVDGAPAAVSRVASVRKRIGPDMTLLVDSGFRRGADILKAIALGADGVLSGRATLYGVAAAGQPGVDRALQLLEEEMETTLATIGCPDIAELGPSWLRERFPSKQDF